MASDELLYSCLNENLKFELLMAQPKNYYQAESLAKLHDQILNKLQNSFRPTLSWFQNRKNPLTNLNTSINSKPAIQTIPPKLNLTSSNPVEISSNSNNIPCKKFTLANLRARRGKGLCYYCDDKYDLNHKCKSTCFLLVRQEDIEEILQWEETEAVAD